MIVSYIVVLTEKKQEETEETRKEDEQRNSEEQLRKSTDESAVVSESETNLVDDLNELLDANVTDITRTRIGTSSYFFGS